MISPFPYSEWDNFIDIRDFPLFSFSFFFVKLLIPEKFDYGILFYCHKLHKKRLFAFNLYEWRFGMIYAEINLEFDNAIRGYNSPFLACDRDFLKLEQKISKYMTKKIIDDL